MWQPHSSSPSAKSWCWRTCPRRGAEARLLLLPPAPTRARPGRPSTSAPPVGFVFSHSHLPSVTARFTEGGTGEAERPCCCAAAAGGVRAVQALPAGYGYPPRSPYRERDQAGGAGGGGEPFSQPLSPPHQVPLYGSPAASPSTRLAFGQPGASSLLVIHSRALLYLVRVCVCVYLQVYGLAVSW